MRSCSVRASCSALATNRSTSITRSADAVSVRIWSSSAWRWVSRMSAAADSWASATMRAASSWAWCRICALVLAQRRGQGGLVDHRVGRPLLGFGHGRPELLLLFLHDLEGPGHRLEVGPHLVGVEASAHDGERVPGDVPGGEPGR